MVKRLFLMAFLGLAVCAGLGAQPETPKNPIDPIIPPTLKLVSDEIPNFLQDISVTIRIENKNKVDDFDYGSGIIKTRDGVHYVLTCAHVIAGIKRENGFDDAQVLKEIYEDGRSVGTIALDAEVLAYSEKEDLALLRVRKTNVFDKSVIFSKNMKALPVATDLYHVGSFHGIKGSGSLSTGIVSKNGRVRSNTIFDQSSCTVLPGSSGGGVFLKSTGEYAGMVVRASGETYNLYIPIRRITAWASRIGAGFIFNDAVPVPAGASLDKSAVEMYCRDSKLDEDFPTLIKKINK